MRNRYIYTVTTAIKCEEVSFCGFLVVNQEVKELSPL